MEKCERLKEIERIKALEARLNTLAKSPIWDRVLDPHDDAALDAVHKIAAEGLLLYEEYCQKIVELQGMSDFNNVIRKSTLSTGW